MPKLYPNPRHSRGAPTKNPLALDISRASGFGAGGRGRTGTVSPPLDFESSTSANSITPA
jgi:hypothetical protein